MKIETAAAKSGDIKVFADGEYRFTVGALTWFSSGYSETDEITEEELTALKSAGDSSSAYDCALRILSLRSHSKKELTDKLCARYEKEPAENAVEKCVEMGFIDDADFAVMYAAELYRNKQYAPARIRAALYDKGIDRENVENALNSLDIDVNLSIISIVEKLLHGKEAGERDKKRIIRRLLSMGYSWKDIKKNTDFSGRETDA